MSPERWKKLEEIFQTALDLAQPARSTYLDRACAVDPTMRTEIDALLSQYAEAGNFIEEPLVQMPPESLTGARIGSYLVEDEIGHGGMGKVYRAARADGSFEQKVAIKVIRRAMATGEVINRFQRERQILAMVNHPNVARMLDGGATPDGQPYFVMELIDGKPITIYCDEAGSSLRERLGLFREVCAAVSHAHQNLVIHRDLKPANIMVTPEGQVKLLDFGIAKVVQADYQDAALTRPENESLLTPEYAAPEQIRGEMITTATDVYALGLILYELLTGHKAQRPTGRSLLELERLICETQPPPPSEVVLLGVNHSVRKLKGDLDNIVARAIQKEPARRYETVSQLSEDIERYLQGRPVKARPDSFFYRSGKFIRRNRLGVAAAAIAVASLIGGIGVAIWQARLARQHFDSVRTLAKSLLTEINPAISAVPGTIKARHLIVQRSLEYLDKLSRSSTRDVALLTETAEAYEAVATIQGNRNKSNLGDYAGAMNSFRKALAIRERIEQIDPSPKNRQWIAMIRAEASRTYPETEEAIRLATGAVEMAERLVQENPSVDNRFALANTHFGLGYIYGQQEKLRDAIPHFEKSRALQEELKRSLNNVIVNDRYLAGIYLRLKDVAAAERHARRALEWEEKRLAKDKSPRVRMDWSYDFQRLGGALETKGDLAGALAAYRKAEEIRNEIAAGDPNDLRGATSLADIHEALASVLASMGKKRESLSYLDKALHARRKFLAAAPESGEDRYELARTYLQASIIYRQFGMCEDAEPLRREAQAVFEAQRKTVSLAELAEAPPCAGGG